MEGSTEQFTRQTVQATDNDGDQVVLEFHGRFVTQGGSVEIYVNASDEVIVVFEEGWEKYPSREAFGDWVSSQHRNQLDHEGELTLGAACAELDIPRVINLD